jgi:hypothetical protein
MLAINCILPVTRMDLSKDSWDTVQTIQNDLLMWQPKFLSSVNDIPQDTDNTSNDAFSSPVAQADTGYSPPPSELNAGSRQSQANEANSEFMSSHVDASDKFSLLAITACLQRGECLFLRKKEPVRLS